MFGTLVIHPTAAVAINWGSDLDPFMVLASAYALAQWGLLAYHFALGAALGCSMGYLARRDDMIRLAHEAKDHEVERALFQSQKLESLGQLAGGVAHDFNNLLSPLVTYLHLAQEATPGDSPAAVYLTKARQITEKAAVLPRNLLAFSRGKSAERELVDANRLVQEFGGIMRSILRSNVEVHVMPGAPALAWFPPANFEQALMNLAMNARDAMPGGGRLTLSADVVEIPSGSVSAPPELPTGAYVRVTVRDTGEGIKSQDRAKIFEPFFTTKEVGKGTGLGLATTYATLRQHGGGIAFESTPGAGTAFYLFLPLGTMTMPRTAASFSESLPVAAAGTDLGAVSSPVL